MGHPEPIKIVIIKKCPKLLKIYGKQLSIFGMIFLEILELLQSYIFYKQYAALDDALYSCFELVKLR